MDLLLVTRVECSPDCFLLPLPFVFSIGWFCSLLQDHFNLQSNQGDSIAFGQVSQEILKVLDKYNQAFGAVKPNTDSEMAIEAEYMAAYNDFIQTFSKIGVQEIGPLVWNLTTKSIRPSCKSRL